MSILYNCHTDGTEYRITKFNDGEVESSYLCSTAECQCPAGSRPTCRHRLMLLMFLDRGAVDTFWFLDFERKGWVSNEVNGELHKVWNAAAPAPLEIASMVVLPDDISPNDLANEFARLLHPDSNQSELGSSELKPPGHTDLMVSPESIDRYLESERSARISHKPSWRRI